jgi:acyl-CoA reductase-like NAD-dependent aldehyde dehydrogenase
MAGNTVVVKPSELSVLAPSLTLQKIAEMFPPGVINIVTGDATEIGDSLVGHPLVRFVNFTGSVRIGKHVMKVAADQMTPVTLELGGNDAAIVCADARLDETGFHEYVPWYLYVVWANLYGVETSLRTSLTL